MKRKSIRLSGYDYSQGGCYFITICSQNMISYFGEIDNNRNKLSEIGHIAIEYWGKIPTHFHNIKLNEFIIMPNHIHGLLWLKDDKSLVGAQYFEPQKHKFQKTIPKSIGSVLRSYKASVTRWCNKNGFTDFHWQRNYYERVVRNEKELNAVKGYIVNNPAKWLEDKYYSR